MAKPKQLKIEYDGQVVFDQKVESLSLENYNNQSEIRSNPLMAAAQAGADPEVLLNLPGEQIVGYQGDIDSTLTITLRVRGGPYVRFLDKPLLVWP